MAQSTGKITRRNFLKTASVASAAAATGLVSTSAHAAEFTFKYANNLPVTHPMNARAKEMAAAIAEQSKGRIELQLYPNNQLGTDTDMLSQVRAGAIDFFTLSPLILGTLVPAAQISGIGFAFKDYSQVWPAMDGELGAHVRKQIEARSTLFAFEKIWDNGYRQITNSTKPIKVAEDLKGMKLRVPPSPLWTSMFKAFDAAPTSINFAEVYSALQTKIVEGQENPMAIISTAKLYEVQKYCSITNHMWDGFWFLGNKKSFERLPKDLQELMTRIINEAGVNQRADVRKLNDSLVDEMKGKGLAFNNADADSFRAKLRAAGFYAEWKKKFGDEPWALLEKYTGKLA
ncbi:TRAP transporter substrate-binding protein [Herbaspirillum seropedicae]|uniref:TRAP-type C4-dicarboxylate transport system, periplasmic component protein n=1 Tax=Herbaspirillum seropedicae (strain SmR1) TaxID=757424 RepID=D8IRV3_HERSS|nr:TRAP transporter substrate-binding protein [Herbaspirillum seropedicae]ADJ65296.1 TRAP-type C4-dicarboxylate transport system, periplasmic component protein [Herbaspirillum seropedicae SmR1]AKN67144.1 ABC transporter substrate-binding protein [Herbaspirillum seropedicae]NQE30254.1 ABC transporter substrate-binding protein [Herbaspirillum seropedicae]UMU23151.1 TRAP transporter substrate-binding protein [Herbaspirillum seropedicae]